MKNFLCIFGELFGSMSTVGGHDKFIKIVTYNVLAQRYIDVHPKKYSYVENAAILSREYRRPRLLASAMSHGKVDVLCFQEFDDVLYWQAGMMINGYTGCYSLRQGKTDGCAIFWDSAKYSLVDKWLIDFNGLMHDPSPVIRANPGKFKRDNIGLVVALEDSSTKKVFCVGTAHLFWDPFMEDVKIHQARWMVNSLQKDS